MTGFRLAFVALAVAWALLLPAAPFAASRPAPASSSAGSALAIVVYGIGRLICHQRPERSFDLFGVPLPVCARCTGIYAAAALMAVVTWSRSNPLARPGPPGFRDTTQRTARLVLLMAVAPTAATLLYEWTTGQTPGQWTRAVSGTPLGAAVAWIVCREDSHQPVQVCGDIDRGRPPDATGITRKNSVSARCARYLRRLISN